MRVLGAGTEPTAYRAQAPRYDGENAGGHPAVRIDQACACLKTAPTLTAAQGERDQSRCHEKQQCARQPMRKSSHSVRARQSMDCTKKSMDCTLRRRLQPMANAGECRSQQLFSWSRRSAYFGRSARSSRSDRSAIMCAAQNVYRAAASTSDDVCAAAPCPTHTATTPRPHVHTVSSACSDVRTCEVVQACCRQLTFMSVYRQSQTTVSELQVLALCMTAAPQRERAGAAHDVPSLGASHVRLGRRRLRALRPLHPLRLQVDRVDRWTPFHTIAR